MASASNYNVMSPPKHFDHRLMSNFAPSHISDFLWRRFVVWARTTVLYALNKGVRKGHVTIVDRTGTFTFGHQVLPEFKGQRRGVLNVLDDNFWVRVVLWYDIGFAEAFLAGEITSPNMKDILNIYVDNLPHLDRLSTWMYKLNSLIEVVFQRFSHGMVKAIENVLCYDASNEFYEAFLSKEMQYSCPIWGEEEGGPRGDLEGHRRPGDLESAQRRKIETVLARARLRPGDRLLEVGTGWGSVAITAAKMGCSVDTVTLSVEQYTLARERVKEAGVSDRVRVHHLDYRQLPADFEKAFDAFVSIEMLEAVGIEWMPTYIKMIDWALKDDRAAVVLTATAYPEGTHVPLQGNDFVRKYHWPNCVAPSATSLAVAFNETLHGRFSLEKVEDFGCHYPRCLREWGRRLEENWTPVLAQSMQERYPVLKDEENLAIFRRRWQYMYVYMEVAYSRVWLSCPMWTFVRPGHPPVECA